MDDEYCSEENKTISYIKKCCILFSLELLNTWNMHAFLIMQIISYRIYFVSFILGALIVIKRLINDFESQHHTSFIVNHYLIFLAYAIF